jgi:NAD(P)-dependent dehydrogenase (short-subunit alcohol dehydrogenase family)
VANRLRNKVAIVFGAGRPPESWTNGAAAAIAYAREGARIVAVDIDADAARNSVDLIRSEGGEAIDVVADVTDSCQVASSVQAGLKAFGTLDVLHNNVALNKGGGPVEMNETDWDRIMTTNVKSLFLTCKHTLPTLQGKGGGSIVNVSSIAGVTWYGRPTIAYASSKAALNQFTRAIAAQYGPSNIRCNAVMPGMIDTPRSYLQVQTLWKGDVEAMRRERSKSVPLRRLGSVWDVANAAVFLASDEAAYVSGIILAVDGALTCASPQSAPSSPAS